MNTILKLIKEQLLKIVGDIDSGNSNLTERESIEALKALNKFTARDIWMSKYQAYTYLNISRATFDNYVRKGILPKGKKESGFKEKLWYKADLDNFIKDKRHDNRKNNNNTVI
jgi:predicted DNA-binding transcriptional regulator AlpA